MNWKMRSFGAVGALAAAGMVAGLPAFATTAVNGTGTVSNCHMSGTVKFNPPLSNTSQAVTTTIYTSITCNGGTGDGANIKSGSAHGTEKKVQSCSSMAGTTAHKIYVSTKWVVKTGKRPLNPSNGTLTSVKTSYNSAGVITFDATGKVNSGSFSKSPYNDIFAHAIIKENVSTVVSKCGSGGVSQLTIQPTSGFKIN
jgi:hypothetical protein